jgi:putative ABC transport system permease protein
LIVVINVKDRRYEMGVLLSLGARRSNILGQIFVELVLVGTLGFALSLGTSGLVAQGLGDSLLAGQLASESVQETEVTAGPERMMRGAQAQSNASAIKDIDVQAGMLEYLTLFGAGYLILLVAMILPSVNILRYQPKEILSGKE